MLSDARRRLVAGLSGRVVAIGAGAGATFAYYPGTVTSVVAVEPNPRCRVAADRAARTASVPIHVVDAVAEALPLSDGAVDAAITSLTLCSVADLPAALIELRRVLRPEGVLRFLEHVLAERGPLRLLQRAAAPVYRHLPGGCHIDRDTIASIAGAGLAIEECHRLMHADGALESAIPHVIGSATAA